MLESSVKNAISVKSKLSNFCGFGETWKALDESLWVTSEGPGRAPAPGLGSDSRCPLRGRGGTGSGDTVAPVIF